MDVSWENGKLGEEADVRTGEADPWPTGSEPGEQSVAERLILLERDDFTLDQSRDDTQKNAF